jgi:hypothetical protein
MATADYFAKIDGKECGPLSSSELKQLVAIGRLKKTDWLKKGVNGQGFGVDGERTFSSRRVSRAAKSATRDIVAKAGRSSGLFKGSSATRVAAGASDSSASVHADSERLSSASAAVICSACNTSGETSNRSNHVPLLR